jgi:hypothetical protein
MRGGRLNQGGDLPPDGGVADGNRTFFDPTSALLLCRDAETRGTPCLANGDIELWC